MKKKILVCDDDRYIRETTERILTLEGYQVKSLEDGSNILSRIEEYKPHLLLLDVMMPEPDGKAITRELKRNKNTRDLPVILFTGLDAPHKICEETGADGYIAKPFLIQEFLMKIESYLRQQNGEIKK